MLNWQIIKIIGQPINNVPPNATKIEMRSSQTHHPWSTEHFSLKNDKRDQSYVSYTKIIAISLYSYEIEIGGTFLQKTSRWGWA